MSGCIIKTVLLTLLFVSWSTCKSKILPMHCCHIPGTPTDKKSWNFLSSITEIYLSSPSSCSNINVAQIKLKTPTGHTLECANGFGLIGFLETVVSRYPDPTPDDVEFLNKLKELHEQFDEVFSANTANSSSFKFASK
uniref:Envelope glycoprotein L n=1 Tax=Wood mouse herpesvirus TaxID=432370 RepID=D0PPD5_9GAMA|nr:envelope glycoprotein L [Wood mouse herpesvirus]